MRFGLDLPGALVLLCGLGSIRAQFLTCGFQHSCEGFVTSIDNYYNVETDVPWTRVSRLQTSNYKAKIGNTFLAIYKPAGKTEAAGNASGDESDMTSRLIIPVPPQQVTLGCLRLRFRLENGSMELRDFDSDRPSLTIISNGTRFLTDGIQQSYSALTPQTNRTLLVATLWAGRRAEFGLDSVRMYRRNCSEVADDDDGDDPQWPPTTTTTTTTTVAPATGDQKDSAAAGVSAGSPGVVTLLIISLYSSSQ